MLAAAGGSQPPPGGGGNDQPHSHHYSLRERTNLKRKKTAQGTSGIPPVQGRVAKRAWRPPVLGWGNKKKRSFVRFGVRTVVVHKLYTGDKGKGKASKTPDPDSYGAVRSHGGQDDSQVQGQGHAQEQAQAEQMGMAEELQMDRIPDAETVAANLLMMLSQQAPQRD